MLFAAAAALVACRERPTANESLHLGYDPSTHLARDTFKGRLNEPGPLVGAWLGSSGNKERAWGSCLVVGSDGQFDENIWCAGGGQCWTNGLVGVLEGDLYLLDNENCLSRGCLNRFTVPPEGKPHRVRALDHEQFALEIDGPFSEHFDCRVVYRRLNDPVDSPIPCPPKEHW